MLIENYLKVEINENKVDFQIFASSKNELIEDTLVKIANSFNIKLNENSDNLLFLTVKSFTSFADWESKIKKQIKNLPIFSLIPFLQPLWSRSDVNGWVMSDYFPNYHRWFYGDKPLEQFSFDRNCSAEFLWLIINNPSINTTGVNPPIMQDVMEAIAQHKNSDSKILRKLWEKYKDNVSSYGSKRNWKIILNDNCPAEILSDSKFLENFADVLIWVPRNKNCPKEVLEKLLKHPNQEIKKEAQKAMTKRLFTNK